KRYFLWCGLKEDQLTYAPHAVDNEFFMADDERRKREAMDIRHELGIGAEARVFLFAGKLEAKKQPLELAEAFASLQSQAHLIYVGSGMLEDELKERYDPHPNIHFVGFQNQSKMPIWYRVADVFCLPSRGPGETWGLAVNEALACGCQAIVSDRVGCAEDLVKGREHGVVFRWSNTQSLHNALEDGLSSQVAKRADIQLADLTDFAAALIQETQDTQQ
ncbi:glycosyltransferase family 4 protein, partial [Flavobacteriales bacterium]|nr:glycosyltransferase family 4 protein [Flavobacteriales bacterium]